MAVGKFIVPYGGSGGGTNTLREYTATSSTWNKPAGLKALIVVCIGGGGGGGSGRRGETSTPRFGGGGGGGASISRLRLLASELSDTYSISIGPGGTGGAAVTADNTDGNNGGDGGNTSFGTLVVGQGGAGGSGGTNAAGAAGPARVAADSTPPQLSAVLPGSAGASGIGTGAANNGLKANANPGGGGGGHKNASNTTTAGGVGGRIYNMNDSLQPSQAPSAGNNGTDNVALQLLFQFNTTAIPTKGLGTSGAGGTAGDNSSGAAMAGGNGGLYGAAGGGGGASLNGGNSGKGGDGSNGLVIVYEEY